MVRIFLIALSLLALANPQGLVGGVIRGSGGSTVCTKLIESTTNNNAYAYVDTFGQSIGVDGAGQICQIVGTMSSEYGGTLTGHLEVWSDIARAGTQYGGDSSTITLNSATPSAKTATFASMPEPPGAYYVHLVCDSGTCGQIFWHGTASNVYANGTIFVGGSTAAGDHTFEIWTMQ